MSAADKVTGILPLVDAGSAIAFMTLELRDGTATHTVVRRVERNGTVGFVLDVNRLGTPSAPLPLERELRLLRAAEQMLNVALPCGRKGAAEAEARLFHQARNDGGMPPIEGLS